MEKNIKIISLFCKIYEKHFEKKFLSSDPRILIEDNLLMISIESLTEIEYDIFFYFNEKNKCEICVNSMDFSAEENVTTSFTSIYDCLNYILEREEKQANFEFWCAQNLINLEITKLKFKK